MVPMTGIEGAMGSVADGDQKEGQKHSVEWLERELAEARADLRVAMERISNLEITNTRNSRDLTYVLNQRDEAYDERDEVRQRKRELSLALDRYSKENRILADTNRHNFDKSRRNADVAAVLACLLATNNSPAEAMIKISETAMKMDVSPDVLGEVKNALKRGYNAQIDEMVTTASPNERDMFEEKVDEMLDDDDFLEDDLIS